MFDWLEKDFQDQIDPDQEAFEELESGGEDSDTNPNIENNFVSNIKRAKLMLYG